MFTFAKEVEGGHCRTSSLPAAQPAAAQPPEVLLRRDQENRLALLARLHRHYYATRRVAIDDLGVRSRTSSREQNPEENEK